MSKQLNNVEGACVCGVGILGDMHGQGPREYWYSPSTIESHFSCLSSGASLMVDSEKTSYYTPARDSL